MEKQESKKKQKKIISAKSSSLSPSVSVLQSISVHLICGLGLALAFWVAHNVFSANLVSDPSFTLRLICILETPIVILLYSWFRLNPHQCSYLKAVGRGLLALPFGALVNTLGAIALGAPVGIQYWTGTLYWSLLMSSFTFVPAASVFGSSWSYWLRIFAHTKPNDTLEYMICIPAHGAVIGAWFGAWPMPLDWERPWQEWPISVTYGAIVGYLVAAMICFGIVLKHGRKQHSKGD